MIWIRPRPKPRILLKKAHSEGSPSACCDGWRSQRWQTSIVPSRAARRAAAISGMRTQVCLVRLGANLDVARERGARLGIGEALRGAREECLFRLVREFVGREHELHAAARLPDRERPPRWAR